MGFKYTSEQKTFLAQSVFSMMCEGLSTRKACQACGLPIGTLFLWMNEDALLAEQYERARNLLLDVVAEDLVEIADDGRNDYMEALGKDGQPIGWKVNGEHVQRSRLRVDTRKWYLSKLAHRKYGDKVQLAGDAENPIAITTIERKIVKPK